MSSENTENTETQGLDLPPIDELNWDTIANYDYSGVSELLVSTLTQIVLAALIFFIGKWLVGKLVGFVKKGMGRGNIDPTLIGFTANILFGLGLALVIIAALSQIGVETTSLAAVIAAAGLAIGLALQGSLSNFAAGFLIILFRFFSKGDYVEIAGTAGTVDNISIFTTTLITPDNRRIVVPNGNITDDNIVNYSAMPTRRIDMIVGVSYDADLPKTQELLRKLVSEHPNTLDDPAPTVEVSELGASSVDFIVRPWVNTPDLWATRWELTKQIKMELDKAGIGIPFPQRDVHLFIEEGQKLPIEAKATKTTKK